MRHMTSGHLIFFHRGKRSYFCLKFLIFCCTYSPHKDEGIFCGTIKLEQNVESLTRVLNQMEFKASISKLKATKFECSFYAEFGLLMLCIAPGVF